MLVGMVPRSAPQALGKPSPQKPPVATIPVGAEPDYSKEPFVIEAMHSRVRFENDGTGKQEATLRIRVVSEAGVQQLGQLVLSYNAANQKMDIGYVRVRKADGTAVIATADAVQDLSAPISTEAPMYTDLRQKHVSVPALQPGETLEYGVTTSTHTALAPGNFWFEYNFEKNAITLDEQLEVDVPRARLLTIKTQPGFEPKTSEEGDQRIYRWSSSFRVREDEEAAKKKKLSRQPEAPNVQLTTFENWEQVGRWYRSLEQDRVTPTPELRAKAEELTRGLAAPLDKIQALYNYVSTNFRYVSLSFGVGRFRPHAAAEVLTNQYGDCKDKHTLLSALAQAVGLDVYPVLIPSQRKVDKTIPSPAHFDHVISAVPIGAELIWLDTTAEVAPFRLLASSLRSKLALVIPRSSPASLTETPADPPFPSTQEVEIEGTLSDLGKLDARVRYALRGDNELVLRTAFRRTPEKQWKQIAQIVANSDGFRGEVKEITPSDPAATRDPFRFEYRIEMPGFLDWSSKRVQLSPPLPGIGLPDADEDADETGEPLELGSPFSVTVRMKLVIPARYTARVPVAVSFARDYAEYRSRYSVEGSTLVAERTMRLLANRLPAARAKDYALFFRRAVSNDEAQNYSLESNVAGDPVIPADAKPEELLQAASAAAQNSNFSVAANLLEHVVAKDPKHKQAWKMLGFVRMALRQFDKAVEAFRKQTEVNPYDENAFYGMGLAYYQQQKYEEAVAALHKQLEVKPLDRDAQSSLGMVLREWRKYAEAAPELEKAVTLAPDDANLYVNLGQTYLNLQQSEKALAAFDKAVELDTSPPTLNNVAYELTLHSVNLDRAQQYAESAVATTSAQLRNAALERLQLPDLQRTASLASYWDTLGWIHFQRGDLPGAEKFVEAAWLLDFHGEVGDHLGQIYEKMGKKQEAMQLYALAAAATHSVPESRGRMAALAGGVEKADSLSKKAAEELSHLRTKNLGRLLTEKENVEAEFYLLLAPGPRVEAVKFIHGSEKLRIMGERLRALDFGRVFPDQTPTKLIRRGALACAQADGTCTFVLQPAENVTSLN
jgi:tetratricopeptide (TPR) repeat protein/transglutaminase-like putative cysteine protease